MNTTRRNGGFTLIELLVVITLLSIMGLAVIPRISGSLGVAKGSMIALTSILSKTFDDSFLHSKMNFAAIHLNGPSAKPKEDTSPLFDRSNGITVLSLNENGEFEESKTRMLAFKKFSSAFRLDEVILSTGEKFSGGTVLIPFYPEGYSEDAILHVTSGNDRWSVIIYKMRKEPRVVREYVDFDAVREGNIL